MTFFKQRSVIRILFAGGPIVWASFPYDVFDVFTSASAVIGQWCGTNNGFFKETKQSIFIGWSIHSVVREHSVNGSNYSFFKCSRLSNYKKNDKNIFDKKSFPMTDFKIIYRLIYGFTGHPVNITKFCHLVFSWMLKFRF